MARTSRAASIAAGMKTIRLRPGQRDYVETISKNDITFCYGPAGTSKTFTACYTALQMLQNKEIKEIILCKPIQEAGEKLGHLPGGIEDKVDPYMKSYKSNLVKIIGNELTETLFEKKIIRFEPLAYMRGITLTDKIVILDESQNAQPSQLKTFLTRIGNGSKFVVTGDLMQSDIKMQNGLDDAIRRLSGVEGLGLCQFELKDVVRHKIVAGIIDEGENPEDTAIRECFEETGCEVKKIYPIQ